jgi:hypothetical protein
LKNPTPLATSEIELPIRRKIPIKRFGVFINMLPAHESLLFVYDVAYSDKYRIKIGVNISPFSSNWMLPSVDLFFGIEKCSTISKGCVGTKWI